jgi:hypothetical protein
MPFSLFNSFRLVAYSPHQAVQSMGSTSYFMEEIGVQKKDFVIPDTRSLPGHIYEWFPSLHRQTLGKFRSLIVFRT